MHRQSLLSSIFVTRERERERKLVIKFFQFKLSKFYGFKSLGIGNSGEPLNLHNLHITYTNKIFENAHNNNKLHKQTPE